jgi:hypothetical protein
LEILIQLCQIAALWRAEAYFELGERDLATGSTGQSSRW